MPNDSLGDRMKDYENSFRTYLPKRLPVIIRVDGRSFHTVTKNYDKPFDTNFMEAMNQVGLLIAKEAQGCVFGYAQSDEISFLLINYKKLTSGSWFENNIQKMTTISAGLASGLFSLILRKVVSFDSRVFVLPENEVVNYFVWRQQDATRNSIQMAARSYFSHSQCNNKNCDELQEMLFTEKGINWNDYPVVFKRGRGIIYSNIENKWIIDEPPIFTQDRKYIENRIIVEE